MEFMQRLRVPLTIGGLLGVFLVERYFPSAPFRWGFLGAAITALVFGWLLTLMRSATSKRLGHVAEAKCWQMVQLWQLATLIAIGLYVIYDRVTGGQPLGESVAAKGLLAAWLLSLTLGIFAGIGLEWSMGGVAPGNRAEPGRVSRAGQAWMLIGMLLAIMVCFNYIAFKKDKARDWSYLKATSAGESTKKMLKSLTADMQAAVFFPADNEVRPFAIEYFEGLANLEDKFTVSLFDKDLNPKEAEKLKVSRNGVVILSMGDRSETINIGLTLTAARPVLRKLDASFQEAFYKLTAKKRVAYLTSGHGEFQWQGRETPVRSMGLQSG